jgi:hypothetical protein
MATVHQFRAPVKHFAHLHGQEGIATLVSGGYLFTPEGCRDTFLVDYRCPDLVLLGRCDLVPAPESLVDAVCGPAWRLARER